MEARRLLGQASPWLVVLAILLAWEGATASGLADPHYLSTPRAVGLLVWQWVSSGFILPHVWATVREVALGYVGGTLAGMAVAFLFFFRPRVAELCDPMVVLLNAAPRAAC